MARFRPRRPSHATVVAYLALFASVSGGTAFAVVTANQVTSKSIANGQVKSQDIATGAVGREELQDSAVSGRKLATGAASTRSIADGAVTGQKLATGAASTRAFADNSITGQKLATGAASTRSIADDGVTGADVDEATLGTVPAALSAMNAANAASAANANTVDGRNATCPAGTVLFLGQCFESAERAAKGYGAAVVDCGDEGGYLPPADQLLAFVALPADNQGATAEQTAELWTIGLNDAADARGWRIDEDTTSESSALGGANAPFRCVFPLVR